MSAPAAHRIGRLRIEADIADPQAAARVQERLRNIAGTRVAAVIERVFDDVDDGMHFSLARLDLDLGTIAGERIEEELPPALERALRNALVGRVRDARSGFSGDARLIAPEQARLDAFETFLRSGRAAIGFEAAAALAALIARQPAALAAMLRRRARAPFVIERLSL